RRSFWFHQSLPRLRGPIRWMKTLPLPCCFAHLSTTVFMRNESHRIASLTTRKKRPTLIFSLPFAKSTTPNALETPRRVRQWTAIAFIAASRKSNGGNRPKTSGDLTTQRKSGRAANQFESDGDRLGIQKTE